LKTAVDSSVLLDVLVPDSQFHDISVEALRDAYDAGSLVACEVVWAEVRVHFPTDELFVETMRVLGLSFDPLSDGTAKLAGQIWRDYRATKRARRDNLIPDFLVGAHATLQADRLLTRDRGFYRQLFNGLKIINPT
jgi:hypothetical protein